MDYGGQQYPPGRNGQQLALTNGDSSRRQQAPGPSQQNNSRPRQAAPTAPKGNSQPAGKGKGGGTKQQDQAYTVGNKDNNIARPSGPKRMSYFT